MLWMSLIAVWPGPAFDPRDYCEFEGVLVPLNGVSFVVNVIVFALVLVGTALVAAVNRPKVLQPPPRSGRVRRLFDDDDVRSWARWN